MTTSVSHEPTPGGRPADPGTASQSLVPSVVGSVGRSLRVASVCSSVGGLDLGLHRAGHQTVFFCEFEPWRRKVLARHWPGVPIHHDLKELCAHDIPPCDLFVGGTPCQDLSVAGKRAGLDGERSGLFHKFAQIRLDLFELHGCALSLWENVAGALSSNEGRDFATVLASHVGGDVAVPAGGWAGSGVAVGPWGAAEWRLVDGQFFGVPQRRRRVFVVGHLGAERPTEVLADAPRRRRNPATSGQAWPRAAAGPARGADIASSLTAVSPDVMDALRTHPRPGSNSNGAMVHVSHTLTANGFDASEDGTGRGTPIVASALDTQQGGGRRQLGPGPAHRHGLPRTASTLMAANGRGYRIGAEGAAGNQIVAATLTAGGKAKPGVSAAGRRQEDDLNVVVGVSFAENQRGEVVEAPVSQSLGGGGGKAGQGYAAARTEQGVRRLTPTECERLMGWPDGWTLDEGPSLVDAPQGWPGGGMPNDPAPDGRRYSACGDGVIAHVSEWIGLGFADRATTSPQEGNR